MNLAERAKQILGERVELPEAASGRDILQPVDLAAAGELVRWVGAEGHSVVPIGSGSKLHWTAPAKKDALYMDMRLCHRVVEYAPEDMTITVEAGITLAGLAESLIQHGQRITLDPPHADLATLGGVLAANDSGPIRFAYGTARDVVIGMSMIQPDGETIKSGGKVVKNVAGYDLHKLYIGSFGTLGPIATVTLRLRPVPEARGAVMLEPANAAEGERVISAVLAGPTRPTFIELVNARMAAALDLGRAPFSLIIGFEETADAVAWQCGQVTHEFGGDRLTDRYAAQVHEKLREAAGLAATTAFKASIPSSATSGFMERFSRQPIRMIARAGNGIVYGLLDESLADPIWNELESTVAGEQGHLQIRGQLPPARPRFGRVREDTHLSEAIRAAFDPHRRFAPYRVANTS
jgi:glycolate oxidase FAD binding subunit